MNIVPRTRGGRDFAMTVEEADSFPTITSTAIRRPTARHLPRDHIIQTVEHDLWSDVIVRRVEVAVDHEAKRRVASVVNGLGRPANGILTTFENVAVFIDRKVIAVIAPTIAIHVQVLNG